MIGTKEGVGQIKTIEGSKEAVKAKGQTKLMMFQTIYDLSFLAFLAIFSNSKY